METVHDTLVKLDTLEPQWEEAFCLAVYRLSADLKLKVLHKKNGMNIVNNEDHEIGAVTIPLVSLVETSKGTSVI